MSNAADSPSSAGAVGERPWWMTLSAIFAVGILLLRARARLGGA